MEPQEGLERGGGGVLLTFLGFEHKPVPEPTDMGHHKGVGGGIYNPVVHGAICLFKNIYRKKQDGPQKWTKQESTALHTDHQQQTAKIIGHTILTYKSESEVQNSS